MKNRHGGVYFKSSSGETEKDARLEALEYSHLHGIYIVQTASLPTWWVSGSLRELILEKIKG